jgi:twitching motility protein PilU
VRLRIKLAQGGDAHTLSQGLDGVELEETRSTQSFGGNNLLNR